MHLLSLIVIMFLAQMTPGPDFIVLIKNSMAYPRKMAMLTAFGISTGLFVHFSLSIFGISILIANSPFLFSVLKVFAAGYLLYLAVSIFRNAGQATFDANRESQSVGSIDAYMEGLLINLLNPKAVLFIISLFTQFMPVDSDSGQKMFYGAVLLFESIIVWILFIIFIQQPRVFQLLKNGQKILEYGFSFILVFLSFSYISTFWS